MWIDWASSFIECGQVPDASALSGLDAHDLYSRRSHWSWRLPLLIQVVIGMILCLGSLVIPESPRWLLDTDQDHEGLRVLADLHGNGDPLNEKARQEYREIKEAVLDDVRPLSSLPSSARPVELIRGDGRSDWLPTARTGPCGRAIAKGSFLPCRRKLSHNW